jgi:cation transport ATPase
MTTPATGTGAGTGTRTTSPPTAPGKTTVQVSTTKIASMHTKCFMLRTVDKVMRDMKKVKEKEKKKEEEKEKEKERETEVIIATLVLMIMMSMTSMMSMMKVSTVGSPRTPTHQCLIPILVLALPLARHTRREKGPAQNMTVIITRPLRASDPVMITPRMTRTTSMKSEECAQLQTLGTHQ